MRFGWILAGGVALVLSAIVLGGPRLLAPVLPAGAMAWVERTIGIAADQDGLSAILRLAGWGTREKPDPILAATHVRDSSDGWKPDNKVAGTPGGGAAFIEEVIDGYTTYGTDAAPGKVTTLAPVDGCSFTPPLAGSFVGHAAIRGNTGLDTGIISYGDIHLAAAVQGLVNQYRLNGTLRKSVPSALRYEVFDIAVTETERPVYLVLETGAGLRVFNIHLARGATLERVVLIGGDQTGVANVPAEVPVEAMPRDKAAACGFSPFYPLNPGHLFFQSVEIGAIKPDEAEVRLAEFAAMTADWEARFRAAFGTGAEETLSGGWYGGTLAAVGPAPGTDTPLADYHPMRGADLRLTVDQYIEFEGQAKDQGFDARVKAIALTFARGDLRNLRQGAGF